MRIINVPSASVSAEVVHIREVEIGEQKREVDGKVCDRKDNATGEDQEVANLEALRYSSNWPCDNSYCSSERRIS